MNILTWFFIALFASSVLFLSDIPTKDSKTKSNQKIKILSKDTQNDGATPPPPLWP